MGKALVIRNEPAYGSERSYNGLRFAGSLAKREGMQVRVFSIGDAVDRAGIALNGLPMQGSTS